MPNLKQEEIYKTLSELDRRFSIGGSQFDLECLSKLALIELGGWVEESVDDVLFRYIERHVSDPDEVNRIKKNVVSSVYGFEFERHLEPLIENVVGVMVYARIKKQLQKGGQYLNFKSVLGDLSVSRNRAAHTHWEGVSRQFKAPSTALNWLKRIYKVFMSIKSAVDKL